MTLLSTLFTPSGRLSRWAYVAAMGAVHMVLLLSAALLGFAGDAAALITSGLFVLLLWPAVCLTIQRLRDMGLADNVSTLTLALSVPAVAAILGMLPGGLVFIGITWDFALLLFGFLANALFWGFQIALALTPGRPPLADA